ncbi:Amino acid permease-associated region OS=Tsukamurella paurometabola (strain ATCC 8368 / DSM/ CCUG 35730 / CIP 100753 / JCM 10117 / KCTC 9821 / NBRC 16120/ NCIMB 702349 / NCTC 13040) OX=521096 GN=Tpau_1741 PE=3 SV=1 [Tsukamurella paurometabola]|uniref:Amino acid permease-associated region n=1 Tax=Tsukamurella paurometabola (strain ATCC 8368 / DSM 20162 / CCUG 35730 / CIP 100753 / JCM 10117 / KCTC 9821 / NBRC 16120 / NCIMB 702349 / NCTC 13040) TaxID=521096 RepID=D5UM79_TSUPD|nr:amino acid permease [Tsukamurella paurometabola]ADG78359.1 amino acid permease-associated region [Tsukamurella paurometabola DSM 20162]SUP31340.1 General aromatic amino acid permease [Tsukamurella paurometabola]
MTKPVDKFAAEQEGYKQTLGRRHVQMIAIGGAIGTGLFLGSATRLNSTGPALLFSYAFVGVIAFFLMRALGEMVLYRQSSGAFVSYAREFFGEGAAFAAGWLYWIFWALTGVAELSAVAKYTKKWIDAPNWVTVIIALAIVLAINLLSARAFGEFEFWASILKVGAIVLFLVVGLVLVIGQVTIKGKDADPALGLPAQPEHQAGISNLWSNPGGFWPHSETFGWLAPIVVMSGVVFAYAAIEMVGIAAGEMQNPQREVPKAVNSVILRIAVFYCGSIFLLVCILPTSQYGVTDNQGNYSSPFVTVFERLGIGWMADLINAVLIVAAMSSLNAGLYTTGRMLRSLAASREAPKMFMNMSKSGVPATGILVTSLFYVAGAVLNALVPGKAFDIALEASAIAVVGVWSMIFISHIRYRKLSDLGLVPSSSFRAPLAPFMSYVGLAFLFFVIVGMAYSGWKSADAFWDKTNFVVVVIGLPIFVIALLISWVIVKPKVFDHLGGDLAPKWSIKDAVENKVTHANDKQD